MVTASIIFVSKIQLVWHDDVAKKIYRYDVFTLTNG